MQIKLNALTFVSKKIDTMYRFLLLLVFGLTLIECGKADTFLPCDKYDIFQVKEWEVRAKGEKQNALLSLHVGDRILVSSPDSLGYVTVDFGAEKYKFTPSGSVDGLAYWVSGCPIPETSENPFIPLFSVRTGCFDLAVLTISTPDSTGHRESEFLIEKI